MIGKDSIQMEDCAKDEVEMIHMEEKNFLLQETPTKNNYSDNPSTSRTRCDFSKFTYLALVTTLLLLCLLLVYFVYINQEESRKNNDLFPYAIFKTTEGNHSGLYDRNDFQNAFGNIVPYWEDMYTSDASKKITHIGPCYLPNNFDGWEEMIERNNHVESSQDVVYMDDFIRTTDRQKYKKSNRNGDDLSGLCRPGFIIIGAGKCGTSSLYHYLTGHPRVLPAREKQIHYFKYYTRYPMRWYLKHFPPAEPFLSSGALITGEASPGYLPEPAVAIRLLKWMTLRAGNGPNAPTSLPKLITIVRNPLERSWSSYKYNYVTPAIHTLMSKDKARNRIHSEQYYHQFLFSFEQLIEAELDNLEDCLKTSGRGESSTELMFNSLEEYSHEFKRRKGENLPPLIAIDDVCYGDDEPRQQFQDLVKKYPEKILEKVPNMHLVQSLIGRSIYVLPLEFWYAIYPHDLLYVVCNEDLRRKPAESLSGVSDFLGLPPFDFSEVVEQGLFNVGGNIGYDTVTKWNETETVDLNDIPISIHLRKRYLDFMHSYNERLFRLIGKRCDWNQ